MPTRAPTVSAADFLPERLNLTALRRAAAHCQGCELFRHATQTVFGEGPRRSPLLLLGEVPGHEEDLEGKPFVGPAGRLLDDALDEIGLARSDVYVTNVVKHFRWELSGKRRLHKKPTSRHIEACRPWLHAEILVTRPRVIVCMGATAAQSLLGRTFRLTKQRGRYFPGEDGAWVTATYHPAAMLRAPQRADRDRMHAEFVHDLGKAARRALKTK